MFTTLRIAYKNTSRQRRRTFLLAGAIGFGFLIITLLNGATGGLENSLRVNFASLIGGHVYVTGEEQLDSGRSVSRVHDAEEVRAAVEALSDEEGYGITRITTRSRSSADVIYGSRTTVLLIDGVDFETESDIFEGLVPVDGTPTDIVEGRQGIILPASTAEQIGVVPGETVILRLSTVTGQASVGELQLVSTFEDTEGLGFSRGYVWLSTINELIGLGPDEFQSMNVFLERPAGMNRAALALSQLLAEDLQVQEREAGAGGNLSPGGLMGIGSDEQESWEGVRYEVTTLNDVLSQVLAIIETLDAVAFTVFAVILLITMVGITNTYRMVVLERRNEIGTMRALGMQRPQVRNIFLSEASITATLGMLIGGLLALLLMLGLGALTFEDPALQFFLINGHFSWVIPAATLVRNVLIVLLFAIVAAWLPARAAGRMRPVEALNARN